MVHGSRIDATWRCGRSWRRRTAKTNLGASKRYDKEARLHSKCLRHRVAGGTPVHSLRWHLFSALCVLLAKLCMLESSPLFWLLRLVQQTGLVRLHCRPECMTHAVTCSMSWDRELAPEQKHCQDVCAWLDFTSALSSWIYRNIKMANVWAWSYWPIGVQMCFWEGG